MMPDLGKYGTEVLSAYGASLLMIAGLVWITWFQSRKIRRALEAAEDRQQNG